MPRGVTLGPRFRDGLGVRVVEVDKTSGDTVEVLHLCPELCAFEKPIKDRTDRLSNFRHPRFAPVRGVQAVSGPHSRLGVIADHIVGSRLSEVLEAARDHKVAVDANAALHLIRELLSAISVLHESRKATHGAIAPERLIVTPRGRLVIVDYTLSLALERLQYNRGRLWRDFRIAMPPTAGVARFDQRADIVQIGALAVALLLGRPLDTSDYTSRLKALLDGVDELTVHADRKPLSSALHSWLERALSLEARKPFATAQQANVALEQILVKERRLGVAPAALRALISRYLSHTGGRATELREPATDQLVQSAAEIATADETLRSAEVPDATAPRQKASSPRSEARPSLAQNVAARPPVVPGRDVPSFTSAVVEADPEVEGPFAAIPLEIIPDTIPEVIPDIVAGIISENPSQTALGVVSEIGSDITMEVASGVDTGLTVEVASGVIAEMAVKKVPEIGPGGGPEAATSDAAESWAPAGDLIAPPTEVPGVTGFDADPERILALERELGVAPKLRESPAGEAEIVTALESSPPSTAAVSLPARSEAMSQGGLPVESPSGRPGGPAREHREPVAEAASDDVWVIEPSDLTFDPAFLDGLYQPPHADLGPLASGPLGKAGTPPAVKPSPRAAPHPDVLPLTHTGEDGSSGKPLTAEAAVAGDAQPASVPESVETLAAFEAARPAALELPPPVAEAVAKPVAEAVAAPVAEVVAESVAEPIAEAVAPEGPLDTAAPPAASVAPVLEPLEVLPALEASWPFVQESPAPVADLVAKLVSKSVAAPAGAPIPEPAAAPVAPPIAPPVAEAVPAPVPEPIPAPPAVAVAPPATEGVPALVPAPAAAPVAPPVAEAVAEVVAESIAEPIAETVAPEGPLDAAAPPAFAVPVPEPLEVLPALEASWPFVQESPAPVANLVAKLVSKSVAASAAAPIPAPPVAPPVAEAVPAPVPAPPAAPVAPPVAETVAETVAEVAAETVAEVVAESIAEPIAEAIAHEGLLDVAAPPAGEEPSPGEVTTDSLGAQAPAPAPHAAVPAEEDSGFQEAVEVFERLLDSLRETPATPAVGALPEPAGVPLGARSETPAGTVEPAATPALPPPVEAAVIAPPAAAPAIPGVASAPAVPMAASPGDRAPLPGQVSASAGARVLTFEPPPIPDGPTAFTPTEKAPLAPSSPRLLIFSAREKAARLARAVPKRLIDLGRTRLRWRQTVAAALALVALGGVRLATAYWFKAPPPTGGLIVETVPDGLEVFIDNALRGRTPMSLTLLAGDHVLELRGRGLTRTLPVRIAPGVQAEERLSWPVSARTGRLRVESEPTRASVSIDGESRGVTPLTIEDLPARVHTLVVQGRGGRVERSVTIEPEQTTTVKVPVFPGWMKVFSPFDLQIFEGGRLLGTTDVDRIMLRAGRHVVEFVNEELGYRVVRQVDITPGALTPVSIEPANGTLQIDAPPGFEVWLDGERVGETPLAPLEVSLGTHDVRLTHPQAGERRQTVVVTRREPARVTAEGR